MTQSTWDTALETGLARDQRGYLKLCKATVCSRNFVWGRKFINSLEAGSCNAYLVSFRKVTLGNCHRLKQTRCHQATPQNTVAAFNFQQFLAWSFWEDTLFLRNEQYRVQCLG